MFEDIFRIRLQELHERLSEMEIDTSYRRREYRDCLRLLRTYKGMIDSSESLKKYNNNEIFSNARMTYRVDFGYNSTNQQKRDSIYRCSSMQ